ncbi:MAG: pyruvate dehydrogenase, partial [Balneolaceae bacterium]
QFRKYADPATEQLKNTGTIRWRTANKFAAPMVVRMPGGFAKCGDPWHSESNEVFFARMIGWQVAYPSNAEDATGLLRSALRSNDPTIFFEHRNLLDSKYARKPYPGDQFVVPFGKAKLLKEGSDVTIVTWGAMCERAEEAAEQSDASVEVIDLRSIMPWDKEMVFESVKKTSRCLIVHEDTSTAGFSAEISSRISDELFRYLDAPVKCLTMPDIPVPYNVGLMNSVLPDVGKIRREIRNLMEF